MSSSLRAGERLAERPGERLRERPGERLIERGEVDLKIPIVNGKFNIKYCRVFFFNLCISVISVLNKSYLYICKDC